MARTLDYPRYGRARPIQSFTTYALLDLIRCSPTVSYVPAVSLTSRGDPVNKPR